MKVSELEFTPELLRELQLIQLECLIELDRICRKRSIEYSIDGGTLLGAVRHGGFIPWDDDIDIIFLRDEYEKFYEACKTELDEFRFFLQEYRTDKHCGVGFARIRRNNTIFVRSGQESFRRQTGVRIDIFMLDEVPNNRMLRSIYALIGVCCRKILWSKTARLVEKRRLLRVWYLLVSIIPSTAAHYGYRLLSKNNGRCKAEWLCHYGAPYPTTNVYKFGMQADLLDSFTELEFEGHMFRAIADYDRYLTALYGEYMTLPPENERKPHIHLSAFSGVNKCKDREC